MISIFFCCKVSEKVEVGEGTDIRRGVADKAVGKQGDEP